MTDLMSYLAGQVDDTGDDGCEVSEAANRSGLVSCEVECVSCL